MSNKVPLLKDDDDVEEVIDEDATQMAGIYIVIGIVLFVLVLIFVLAIYCFWRHRQKAAQGRDETDNAGATMRLSLLGQAYQNEAKPPAIEIQVRKKVIRKQSKILKRFF